MKNTLRILALLLGFALASTACQTTISQTGIKATWVCDGNNKYKVTVTNPTTQMQEVYTSENSYIEQVTPGENYVLSKQTLPWNGLPHVYVSVPGPTSEDLFPAEHMICK